MKRKLKKLNLKIGAIYVEPYDCETNEERGRSKIYDSIGNYLTYISTESITEQQYYNILADLLKPTNIQDFIENKLFVKSYDYDTDLDNLLYSLYDSVDDETFTQLENDISTNSEEKLISDYRVNKIGKYYLYIDDILYRWG